MTRKTAITLLLIFAGLNLHARTAVDFFNSAPDSIMQVLPHNTRLDMVDYYNSTVPRASDNRFGGKSQITAIDSTSVAVMLSEQVDAVIAVIATRPDTIVMYAETIATPIPDTDLRFYSSEWKLLPAGKILNIKPETWLKPGLSKAQRREALTQMPFMPASATYDPATATLTITNNLGQYYTADDSPAWLEYLLPELTLHFNGRKFLPAKK